MIPSTIGSECKSPGEREIFGRLRDDPGTRDWIVLHSLDVANHQAQVAGEVDFVIIIPGLGALCLEVKACRSLRRHEGAWYYGQSHEPDFRGPFKQVSEAMHSLRKRVTSARPGLAGIPFWSAVIFPYIRFAAVSCEWHSWQVIDSQAYRSRPLAASLASVLVRARELLAEHRPSWWGASHDEPSRHQCDTLAEFLRPTFEYFETPRARINRTDAEIKRYTADQTAALDALDSNARIIFQGPAGTGKTILALESARRASNAGRRVLFVCFNRLLGDWVARQLRGVSEGITASTLHKHMLDVAGLRPEDHPAREYWETLLPDTAIERLLGSNEAAFQFDELIIDEAQDILRATYLDFLDLSVKGGLAAGRWRMFGDFEKQAIYGSDGGDIMEVAARRAPNTTHCELRTNCRNTPRIAEIVHLLGGLEPGYQHILRPDDGLDPDIRYYSTRAEEEKTLSDVLIALLEDGFAPGEIVVLSPLVRSAGAGLAMQPSWSNRLHLLGGGTHNGIGFGSVHAFKGLESKAVVVTDVEEIGTPAARSLLYVGTSRALHRLTILANQRVKAQARAIIRQEIDREIDSMERNHVR